MIGRCVRISQFHTCNDMNWIFGIGVYILRLFFPSIVCHRKSSCIIVHVTPHRVIDAEFAKKIFESVFSSAKRVRLPSVTTQRIFYLRIKLNKNLFKIKKLRIFGFYARHWMCFASSNYGLDYRCMVICSNPVSANPLNFGHLQQNHLQQK